MAMVMPMSTGSAVAGGERERHELGLVAQLGDEDDPETDRERDHEPSMTVRPSISDRIEVGGRLRSDAYRIEGLARLVVQAARPGFPKNLLGTQYVDRDVGSYSPSRAPPVYGIGAVSAASRPSHARKAYGRVTADQRRSDAGRRHRGSRADPDRQAQRVAGRGAPGRSVGGGAARPGRAHRHRPGARRRRGVGLRQPGRRPVRATSAGTPCSPRAGRRPCPA